MPEPTTEVTSYPRRASGNHRCRPRRRAVALALLAFLLPFSASAQEVITLAERRCEGCSVRLTPIATLQSGYDGPLTGEPSSVSRDARGRYLVTQYIRFTEFAVFRPDGSFEGTFGREGRGPGEFVQIDHVAVLGDSVLVFDPGNRQFSILDADFEFGRAVRFPAVTTTDVIADGRVLTTVSDIPTTEQAGLPIHEFQLSNEELRSYGAADPLYRPQSPWLSSRVITGSRAAGIWSAKRTAYELEYWVDGALKKTLRRDVRWFRPYVERIPGSAHPPEPWLMAIRRIDDRFLAVLVVVPSDDFIALRGPRLDVGGRQDYDIGRRRLLYDTRVEVIDTQQGSVVYTGRMDDYVPGFVDGTNILYTYNEVDGVPTVTLVEFSFLQQSEE
jgi:hypothetical protein